MQSEMLYLVPWPHVCAEIDTRDIENNKKKVPILDVSDEV
jgi:hypothetical protein